MHASEFEMPCHTCISHGEHGGDACLGVREEEDRARGILFMNAFDGGYDLVWLERVEGDMAEDGRVQDSADGLLDQADRGATVGLVKLTAKRVGTDIAAENHGNEITSWDS